MAIGRNGAQIIRPKMILHDDVTLFGTPALIKFRDSNRVLHYLKGYYNGNFEYETMQYLSLPDVSLTQAQQAALDANIKAIKYGSGIVLSSLTAKPSLASGYYFVTQSSVDLRPYALISGVQFSFSDGSKTAVFTGIAMGTGETLDATERVTAWTNDVTYPYETFTTNNGDITSAVNSTGLGIAHSPSYGAADMWVLGSLYKSVIGLTLNSGTAPYIYAQQPGFLGMWMGPTLSAGANNNYFTAAYASTSGNFDIRNQSTKGDWAATVSLKIVLTPSTSGFLSSALTVESGFNPNAASFTVTITRP